MGERVFFFPVVLGGAHPDMVVLINENLAQARFFAFTLQHLPA